VRAPSRRTRATLSRGAPDDLRRNIVRIRRQPAQGGGRKEDVRGNIDTEPFADQQQDARNLQRASSQGKEIVVRADRPDSECLAPRIGNRLFSGSAGRDQCRGHSKIRFRGGGQGAAVDFAMRSLRYRIENNDGRGQHVRRQAFRKMISQGDACGVLSLFALQLPPPQDVPQGCSLRYDLPSLHWPDRS